MLSIWLLKMNYNGLIFTPVRLISRSCCRPKVTGMGSVGKKDLNIKQETPVPVEKDTQKLATYVCGTNLFIEGGSDVQIKPDSEYPEWLWSMGPFPPLEKLDKNTKNYWNRVLRIREREIRYLKSLQRNKSVHK